MSDAIFYSFGPVDAIELFGASLSAPFLLARH